MFSTPAAEVDTVAIMTSNDNPIERRLEQLYDHWDAFMDAREARLLRWRVHAQQFRCIEAFFAAEDDERAGRLPVVFLRFEDPFDGAMTYAVTLRERLLEMVAHANRDEQLGSDEPPLAAFRPPLATGNSIRDLLMTAEALCQQQGVALPMLAMVLLPSRIVDDHAWLAWLRIAVKLAPASIRLIAFDYPDTNTMQSLADAEPELVHSEFVDIDLAAAAIEVSAEAGHLDQPEGQFRHAYVQMLYAIAKQDLTAAHELGAPALELARRQGWGHLEIAVMFALGCGFLQAKQPQQAIELYECAERRAVQGQDAGEPWGGILQLNARLATAAAAVIAEAWPQAAQIYLETAPLARSLNDTRVELDCVRMASYCRSNHGQHDEAWILGLSALDIGEGMDEQTRKSSTLAFVGIGLERTARHVHGDWRTIERRMIAALGPTWRPINTTAGFAVPGRELTTS